MQQHKTEEFYIKETYFHPVWSKHNFKFFTFNNSDSDLCQKTDDYSNSYLEFYKLIFLHTWRRMKCAKTEGKRKKVVSESLHLELHIFRDM